MMLPTLRDENGIHTRLSPDAWAALERSEAVLDEIGDRLQHVVDAQRELKRVTRGKAFLIYGRAHWNAAAATLDMMIIDLASWLEGLWEKGGFLLQIGTNEPGALAREWRWSPPKIVLADDNATPEDRAATIASLEAHELAELKRARDARYAKMFPDAAAHGRDVPSHRDINDTLLKELKVHFKSLIDDRNQHRAHKYEKRVATVAALKIEQVIAHHRKCQELFNDLRLLSSESSYGHNIVRDTPRSLEARDIADLILFGDINQLALEMARHEPPRDGHYWEWRDRYFAHLHMLHDRSDGTKTFNDRTLIPFPNPEVW